VLVALRVERFILIDALELRLEPGLNVLTGETGAGKSIVVGALDLVLGGRASPDLVRAGARQAEVEALFDLGGCPELVARLESSGIDVDGELCIRRVVQATGRSRAYLNGRLCAARELAQIAPELADITSQHESSHLADSRRHIEYLDRYARLLDRRAELGAQVDRLAALGQRIADVREQARTRADREGFLRFQRDAIDAVGPRAGELDELRADRNRLRHAERLREVSTQVAVRLDQSEQSVCDELGRLAGQLSSAAELDPTLDAAAAELDECWSRLREVAGDVGRYAERIEAEPDRLEQTEERIYQVEQLLRQHGPTEADLIDSRARIERQLGELAASSDRLTEIADEYQQVLGAAGKLARQLSGKRRKAGRELGRGISARLAELDMGEAKVVVAIEQADAPTDAGAPSVGGARLGRTGLDRVEFLIAPNAGTEPKPLGRIASGGELSRALLAIKVALGGYAAGAEPTLRGPGVQVFDEVDAGIGGATADAIGRCVADVARHRQVLCITHLAPIAAYGDAHFVVDKRSTDGSTQSEIRRLRGKKRIAELARMLSGAQVTGSTKRAAQELRTAALALVPARG
jgi:DNA repair protein RecN (Recombination protein N)